MGVVKNKRGVVISGYDNLNENQKTIYNYIVRDNLNTSQIAKLKGVSRQAVIKTINKLCNYGLLKQVSKGVYIKGGYTPTTTPNDEKIYRLHGIGFKINIIESSPRYENILKTRNKDELENNTLCLYDDHLIIYLNKDFYGEDPQECESLSLTYINRFIIRLENNYNFILKKNRQFNLKQFKGEIAKTNDAYAKKCNLEKESIKIRDDNGVLRLIVDNSFNLNELEAVNNEKHIKDMSKINKKWLDMIQTDLLLSDVEKHLKVQQHTNFLINERTEKIITALEKLTELLNK